MYLSQFPGRVIVHVTTFPGRVIVQSQQMWGNMGDDYIGSLCTISYNCMCIYKYFQKKTLNCIRVLFCHGKHECKLESLIIETKITSDICRRKKRDKIAD